MLGYYQILLIPCLTPSHHIPLKKVSPNITRAGQQPMLAISISNTIPCVLNKKRLEDKMFMLSSKK
jgi:hypothetical protein